jgi:GNAT superfamily N-acetyltransferase
MTRELPADNATAAVIRQDGDAVLQAMRMAIDPAAQAEVARLDEIGEIAIRDVTPDRLGDYQRFFDQDAFRDYPAWRGCYCMEPLFGGSDEEWAMRSGPDNRAEVSRRLTERETTALLAYAGDRPVGWCHYGPTTRLAQLMRRYELKTEEQERVGSIGCFIIASPYRGHGVARQLLDAACHRLRGAGMEWVEAYPRGDRKSAQGNFRGPLSLYQAAGFQPHREMGAATIMRKRLV